MNWSDLLTQQIEYSFAVTDGLIKRAEDDKLDWKPSAENNWMTLGQLLQHLSNACGMPMHGFVTGEWGMPADFDPSQMKPEDMIPPAEKLPTTESVAAARTALAEDKQTALAAVAACDETRLDTEPAPAPWDPTPMPLGARLLSMVDHQTAHKCQLFYYLKLQGQPVNTQHLWSPGA